MLGERERRLRGYGPRMDNASADLRSLLDRLKEAQHALIEDGGTAAWAALNGHHPQDRRT